MSLHPNIIQNVTQNARVPRRRGRRFGRPALTLLLLGATGGLAAGCDRPCDRLLERVDTCAKKSGDADLYEPRPVQEKLRLRCRRAVSSRIKACLKERTCPRLMQCSAKALRASPARL